MPGADSSVASYYKCFEDELLQPLQNLMNSILKRGNMPNSWKEANKALTPKEGQALT